MAPRPLVYAISRHCPPRRFPRSRSFQDRRDAHAPCRAHRNQAATATLSMQQLGENCQNAGAGRGKRMAEGDARAFDVELCPVDRAKRPVPPKPVAAIVVRFPGLQCGQHLGGEGLMNFIKIKVLQRQAALLQEVADGDGRGHQKPLARHVVDGRGCAQASDRPAPECHASPPIPRRRAARLRRRR